MPNLTLKMNQMLTFEEWIRFFCLLILRESISKKKILKNDLEQEIYLKPNSIKSKSIWEIILLAREAHK